MMLLSIIESLSVINGVESINTISNNQLRSETTLLACPEEVISNDYLLALERHFGLITK